MIVSASYRTDIPAFYGPWFLNRFRAGWAKVINPYGGQTATISLRGGVDGFVFWTRNIGPFRDALAEVRRVGLPFMVHYTVTGYPRALERSVIETERSTVLIRDLAETHGRRVVVWRYDPIVISSLTPPQWHRDNFARLADSLTGAVDEVSVSFAALYRKTERNMAAASRTLGFDWSDPTPEEKRALAAELAILAAARGIALSLCSQPEFAAAGTQPSRCVDARRLEDVAAGWGALRPVKAKVKGNRPGCLCHESRDIGQYESCPHGCVYCYAVDSRSAAKRRAQSHDPLGECLIP
ncbi:conserved hypothetical protein [Candidatus Terasakiella magnetica]|nr:conserved hypothetical protein [Candidatus Terasakiella magnetica]